MENIIFGKDCEGNRSIEGLRFERLLKYGIITDGTIVIDNLEKAQEILRNEYEKEYNELIKEIPGFEKAVNKEEYILSKMNINKSHSDLNIVNEIRKNLIK